MNCIFSLCYRDEKHRHVNGTQRIISILFLLLMTQLLFKQTDIYENEQVFKLWKLMVQNAVSDIIIFYT